MQASPETVVAGIPIPSHDPAFLVGVAVHVGLGLGAVACGAGAMLSRKGHGRHSRFGVVYLWFLTALAATAAGLAFVRWAQDWSLFVLGAGAATCAWLGRTAARRGALRLHVPAMGTSYILMLTAFYVDNGPNLPFWRALPPIAYWTVPSLVGAPLILWALLRHPLLRRADPQAGGGDSPRSAR